MQYIYLNTIVHKIRRITLTPKVMTIKQYTRLYFTTVFIFIVIAFWQQLKMASLRDLSTQAAASMTTGLPIGTQVNHQARQDSIDAVLKQANVTIQRYQQAHEKLKTTHPEAAKKLDEHLHP